MSDFVRVQVDQEKCIGSGICEMLEEATFLIDDDTNVADVQGSAALPAERAAKVIDECPSSAISVTIETAHPASNTERATSEEVHPASNTERATSEEP